MPRAPASVSDQLKKLEKRLDSMEKPSASVIVGRFLLACLEPADGVETSAVDIFHRYERWCREHHPLVGPVDMQAFAEHFGHRCRNTSIETRRIETLYYVGVAISA